MNIHWEYILSTYIKIYHEGCISRIFVRNTYTISKGFNYFSDVTRKHHNS